MKHDGPTAWLPRSPNVNPLISFVRRHVTTLIYSMRKLTNNPQVIQEIHVTFYETENEKQYRELKLETRAPTFEINRIFSKPSRN